MSDEKYIVLRTPDAFVPTMENVGAGPTIRSAATMDVATKKAELEEVSLSSAEADDLRRDPSATAFAPPMPMSLIEPVDMAGEEVGLELAASGNTWGVDAVGAGDSTFDGSGVTVAVLDTGIDPDHSAFSGVNLIRENFTDEGPDDTNGHGTHCAGTIFGRDTDGTRIGVARGVDKAIIGKVLGQGGGSSGQLADAINWSAENGANVISMSLGIDFPGYVKFLVEQRDVPIEAATSMALNAYRANINLFSRLMDFLDAKSQFGSGVVTVAASGNESNRNNYDIAVAPPAAGDGLISVGALQQGAAGFAVARFSNTQCNVSAPGVAVSSAQVGGGLKSLNGTSMATPHVAGVAALWAQHEMENNGRITSLGMRSKVVGMATRDRLDSGMQFKDVGAGIVSAP